jgi:hypothetical protein
LRYHREQSKRAGQRRIAVNRALTTIALVRKVAGAAFVIVNLLATGTALAQDKNLVRM